ncbi:MAG: hypothetical protein COT71_02690 [Candidatus Andersenbacteria bacterium CG10_big_fil_rev_8_21_14_0_10_54_11]|uniref:ATP synthase F1 complex delta/epsilon subunit N-terminal domain-containing protein n=1 Tax=Candidatus Andersenbacteria bacterium CG10_big_fil_rev_8_21_14_0_10_54_11 TaxID=1974485 RepID=A0A2M6WZA0_9BACT|nr:MAG: hypothetical protein COT71_02690 [Candidatus Andersenbacteria bacterium CG10_big_fil_rev_8_21_14_0_10_54_11]
MNSVNLRVKVVTPETVIYNGPALAVGTRNTAGPLSILPLHINFISIVDRELVIRLPDGTEKQTTIDQGVLYCRENVVEVYIGIGNAVELPKQVPSQNEGKAIPAGTPSA